MITLALDASTYVASLAVLDGTTVKAAGEVAMRGADEERLLPAVAATLASAGVGPHALGRIVCGEGPGSFTSLRIAASIAKGLATGARVPLFAMSSLAFLAAASAATLREGRYVAALDALRGEHYVAVCSVLANGEVAEVGRVERWPTEELHARAGRIGPLIGPGLEIDARPDVTGLTRLHPLLVQMSPVDLGSWEPAYGRLAEAQVKWEAAHGRPLQA